MNAATVAVIVHGVGDHSRGDVLLKAKHAVGAIAAEETRTREVTVPHLPELEASGEEPTALLIEARGKSHIILPFGWSRMRPRARNEADLRPQSVQERWALGLPALVASCIDVIRCLPPASGLGRKALAGSGILLYLAFVPSSVVGFFYLLVFLPFWIGIADPGHLIWYRAPALVLVLVVLNWFLEKMYMVWDFVGDVAAYVGRKSHQAKAEQCMLTIIESVAARAPQAQILVVAHSLGSILVVHSAMRLSNAHGLRRRLILLTLGSPLRLMSRLLPGRICSPDDLVEQLEQRGVVRFWINLWRDADWIGRALKPRRPVGFAEASVGDGAHQDYWGDKRLWQAVVSVLQAADSEALQRIQREWAKDALDEEEKKEFLAHLRFRKIRHALTNPLTILGTGAFWIAGLEYGWFERVELRLRVPTLALGGVITVLMLMNWVFSMLRLHPKRDSPTEMLGQLRLWKSVCQFSLKWAFALTTVLAVLVLMALYP